MLTENLLHQQDRKKTVSWRMADVGIFAWELGPVSVICNKNSALLVERVTPGVGPVSSSG